MNSESATDDTSIRQLKDFLSRAPNDIKYRLLAKMPLGMLLDLSKRESIQDLISNAAFAVDRSHQTVFLNMKDGYSLVDTDNDTPYQVMNLRYPFDAYREDEVEVVGTVHGLILLSHCLVEAMKTFWIFNPIMKTFKKLSVPCQNKYLDMCGSGLGYDAGIDSLKYVRLYHDHCPCGPKCRKHWIGVLNIKTNMWTTIEHACIPFEIKSNLFTNPLATYFSGSLYWFYNSRYVLTLDIQTLMFTISEQLIPAEIIVSNYRSDSGFEIVDKNLCLFVRVSEEQKFMIWRLESNIWSLYSSFVLHATGIHDRFKPLCLLNDGKLLFCQSFSKRLFLYDDTNHSRTFLDTDGNKIDFKTRALVVDDSFMLNSSSGGELVETERVVRNGPFNLLFAYCGSPLILAAEALFRKLVIDGNLSSRVNIDFAQPCQYVHGFVKETDKLMKPIIPVCDKRGLEIKTAPRVLKISDLTKYDMILVISRDKKECLRADLMNCWRYKTIPMKTIANVRCFGHAFNSLKADADFDKVLDLLEKRCRFILGSILKNVKD